MVAYSYKKRFVAPMRAKIKRHTIRLPRKGTHIKRLGGHAVPGERENRPNATAHELAADVPEVEHLDAGNHRALRPG